MINNKTASTLAIMMIFMVSLSVLGVSLLRIALVDRVNTQREIETHKGRFLADAGLQRALWKIKNNDFTSEVFELKGDDTAVNNLEEIDINISITSLGSEIYQVASTAQFGNVSKTINAIVEKHPPSEVFDYTYFINNWGWFYGSPIYTYGDIRSNGRFDFRYGPTVNSSVYAGQEIGINGTVYGYGADSAYQHPNSSVVDMPNLYDLSYYEGQATANSGSIVIDGTTIVNGVQGDSGGENENLVLVGTATNPIEINGTVVIRGDVIVSGYITGQGTIYAGRNLYIPNNVIYSDGPATPKPTYPSGAPPLQTDIETWVTTNQNKDLVGFAAVENIVVGDYTKSSNQWIFNNYLYHMGDEDVGQDGIPDTGDTGEGDGYFNASYEDIDEDGLYDDNYNSSDLQTQVSLASFGNLPAGMTDYDDIVRNPDTYTSGTNTFNGVYYTNHAIAGVMGNTTFNGSIISKDESLGISSINLNYDWRTNSQFASGDQKVIDLDLPYSSTVEVLRWWE